MRRKLAIDPRQIEHRCNRTHLVIVRYHLFKTERIKQLSLVLLQPTHHGPFPPLTASTSGNHCSRKHSTDFCNKIGARRTRFLSTGCQPCQPCQPNFFGFAATGMPGCELPAVGWMARGTQTYRCEPALPLRTDIDDVGRDVRYSGMGRLGITFCRD